MKNNSFLKPAGHSKMDLAQKNGHLFNCSAYHLHILLPVNAAPLLDFVPHTETYSEG